MLRPLLETMERGAQELQMLELDMTSNILKPCNAHHDDGIDYSSEMGQMDAHFCSDLLGMLNIMATRLLTQEICAQRCHNIATLVHS